MAQIPRFFLVLPLFFVMAGCRLALPTGTAAPSGVEVPIQNYNVFDMGVADLDGDGRDDLYTVNHNAQPTLLRSTGNAELPFEPFEPLPTLPHDPRFPVLADLSEPPVLPDSGALVYWVRGRFHISTGSLSEPVQGKVMFRAEPVVERMGGSKTTVTRLDASHWVVRFQLADREQLIISHQPYSVAGWPVQLVLDSNPNEVSIGQPGDHPERESTFRLRDYHALAIRDLNGDERPDITALGGGLRGRAAELIPDGQENTFLSSKSGYVAVPGPPKVGCATRSGWWEGDTLRVTCARGQADNMWVWATEDSSNSTGRWRGGPADVSTDTDWPGCKSANLVKKLRLRVVGKALCTEGDFDGDGALELVVATKNTDNIATATLYDSTP